MQTDLYPIKVIYGLTSSSGSLLWASYILAALATLVMLLSHLNILLLAVIGCALVQHYLFIRVQFDRQLLKQLIASTDDLSKSTQSLDQALLSLGMIQSSKADRPWSLRLTGILGLFKFQCAVLVITSILFMMILVIGVK